MAENHSEELQQLPEHDLETAADEVAEDTSKSTDEGTIESTAEHTKSDEHASEVDGTRERYINEDVLLKHIDRQCAILKKSLESRWEIEPSIKDISHAFECQLFCPRIPPRRQENGTCEPNPHLNFYPTFIVPETQATYHIFFQNQKIPLSCRANRTMADTILQLKSGDKLPCFPTVDMVSKIFEGLGDEETATPGSLEKADSALVELVGDNPRLAVVKRTIAVTHFAYPAISLPPKVMTAVMNELIMKTQKPNTINDIQHDIENDAVVTDCELAKWLNVTADNSILEERRKTMAAVVLVTLQLECMHRFFTNVDVIKKLEESLHYTFRHGYVKLACSISNVELPNIISYMGILHENRLGHSTLHSTLKDESRRDYIRDCVYLYLIHTWQTAMGIWQQCLEDENINELRKILNQNRRKLWSGFDELTIAQDLADMVFPPKLLGTLQNGLPDFTSQSVLQNFRSFILERSGILPSMCNALPSDFVPITYRECPPTLWPYTYLLKLANYLMFHSDIAFDHTGEGILDCYCRCNLCTPHRCLATNNPLLNETQVIGSFEIQGPPDTDGQQRPPLRLTSGLWTSAFLRKFVPEDYHAHKIQFYEDQSKKPKVEPSACVITQDKILAQLHEIKKARQEFLLKRGHGLYLDPITGEELNGPEPSAVNNSLHSEDGRKYNNEHAAHRSRNNRNHRRRGRGIRVFHRNGSAERRRTVFVGRGTSTRTSSDQKENKKDIQVGSATENNICRR